MDAVLGAVLAISTFCLALATLGFALLNFVRSGMGARLERLEISEADCQQDRIRLERLHLHDIEEIARLAILTQGVAGARGPRGERGEHG